MSEHEQSAQDKAFEEQARQAVAGAGTAESEDGVDGSGQEGRELREEDVTRADVLDDRVSEEDED